MTLGGIALAADFALVVVTATALSFLARQTRQPTIVAYILTGLLLGPVVLGIVTEDQLIDLMAELGLGFLLFLLGLEMRFDRIREILRPVINVSVGQTILQTALAFAIAFALGFRGMDVVVIALATVFGATPVIVKLLDEQDQLKTLSGRIDVGVLIVQDIYLVIVLALVGAGLTGTAAEIGIDAARILGLMAAIGLVAYASYRYVLPWLLRAVAHDRDVLFAVGIAWAFLFIFGAETLELSVEVGAFIAGLSIAQLPYSTEIKERMRPVTDFFLVVFFASIGLRLTAEHLLTHWQEALIASAVLMVGNFLIMFALINREAFTPETSFLGSVNMVQVSEFSLVVGALAVGQELVGEDVLGYLSLMAVLTMTVSTYVIVYNERLYALAEPYLERFESAEEADADLGIFEGHAVIVGYDDLVRESIPLLREEYGDVVLVDRSASTFDEVEDVDVEHIYGDIRHDEIREEADLEHAAFVLSAATDAAVNARVLEEAPEGAVAFVTVADESEVDDLYERGAAYVIVRDRLAGDRLAELIGTYLTNREEFEDVTQAMIEALRSEGGEELRSESEVELRDKDDEELRDNDDEELRDKDDERGGTAFDDDSGGVS